MHLTTDHGVNRVFLFGSYARGEASDMVIVCEQQ
jgi:predicted nucleotidyltransferase